MMLQLAPLQLQALMLRLAPLQCPQQLAPRLLLQSLLPLVLAPVRLQ